jgi:tricorn protease
MGRLWIDRLGDGAFTRVHEDLDGNIECPLWVGDRIAFLSDHEENGRLWSSLPDGSDLRCHTAHSFATRGAATDGARVVYHSGGGLWLLDGLAAGAVPEPVGVGLGSPAAARAAYAVTGGEGLEDFDTGRSGREAVVTVRGSVHHVGNPAEPTRELPREAGTRARLPRVLGDTGKVARVVVVDGREGIEVGEVAAAPGDKAASHRFGTGLLGRVRELVAAPDGESLAMATHDGRVLVASVASGALREVDRTDGAEATDVVFSPDSRWLAWSHPGANGLRQIRLADLANCADLADLAYLAAGGVVEATPLRFSDRSPAFTRDGRYLTFLSERGFEPVPQAHLLGPAFAAGTRLCLLPLAKDTPSPFSPHDPRRAVHTGEVTVDRDGLAERVELFPVPAGDFIALRAAEGGVLWIRKDPSGHWMAERGTLMRW